MMMKMPGAQIIVETLISQGVTTVFGYPGGQVLNIYDELYKASDRIRHVITAHEQGAAHAADGYARSTGKVGVVIATSGPGASNLVTGIATAYLDSTPMVAITGNVPLPLIGRDSFQEVDIAGITMPITKHNYIVKDVKVLEDTIREAFQIAKSGRPGPVLIDVPKDVQIALCDYVQGGEVAPDPFQSPTQEELVQAAKMVAESKRPFLYSGGGIVSADASKELLSFADRIDAPIGTSMMGLSAVASSYPGFLGMTGMHGRYAASKAMAEADLIIAVGTRFSDRATGNKDEFAKKAQVLHIDIDPAEIGKNIPAQKSLIGNIKDILARLCALLSPQTHEEWKAQVETMRAYEKENQEVFLGLSPQYVIQAANRILGDDILVATDVGQHQMWTAQYYPFSKPRSFITSGGLGTMGFGMGAAIGSCIANGEKRTVLFTGDGSFHMNLNEMSTAVANRLPLVIVVMNNGVLGMVRQWQTLFYGQRYSNTTLDPQTDFVKLAEAFGAKGIRVTNQAQVDAAYREAMETRVPVLIDCIIHPDEKVLPMIPPGGTIDDIMLK